MKRGPSAKKDIQPLEETSSRSKRIRAARQVIRRRDEEKGVTSRDPFSFPIKPK
jgi:hypothetical protein